MKRPSRVEKTTWSNFTFDVIEEIHAKIISLLWIYVISLLQRQITIHFWVSHQNMLQLCQYRCGWVGREAEDSDSHAHNFTFDIFQYYHNWWCVGGPGIMCTYNRIMEIQLSTPEYSFFNSGESKKISACQTGPWMVTQRKVKGFQCYRSNPS